MNHRHDDDHDAHGGLHRDLTATGSAMGRRGVLRRFAFGAGALALLGCGDAGSGVLTGTDDAIDTETGSNTGNTTCKISLASDNVFSDGAALELATVTGSVSSGIVASITVAV